MIIHVRTAYLWETHDVGEDCTFGELKEFLSDRTGIPLPELELKVGYPAHILHHPSTEVRIQDLGITSGTEIFVRPSPTKSLQADRLQHLGYPQDVINSVFEKTEFYPFEEVLEMCDDESIGTKDDQSISPHRLKLERVSFTPDSSSVLKCVCYLLQLPYDHTHLRNLISCRDERRKTTLPKNQKGPSQRLYDAELRALSTLFNVEIIVVDSRSLTSRHYGQELREREWERNNYHKKMILFYDGKRYDALLQRDLKTNHVTTLFVLDNQTIVEDALEFLKDLMKSTQDSSGPRVFEGPKFHPSVGVADISRFRCQTCHQELVGEGETIHHSELNHHHTNFNAIL
eukprot:gene10963-11951_t